MPFPALRKRKPSPNPAVHYHRGRAFEPGEAAIEIYESQFQNPVVTLLGGTRPVGTAPSPFPSAPPIVLSGPALTVAPTHADLGTFELTPLLEEL